MSSDLERNLHEVSVSETQMEIQNFHCLHEPNTSQQQQGISGELPLPYPFVAIFTATQLNEGILNEGEPAELFDVVIEDGIHSLAPSSTTMPETGLEIEHPESSRAQAGKTNKRSSSQIDEIVELHEQANNLAPSRKKRQRTEANVKETTELVFQLFISDSAPQEFILEKNEASQYKRYHLLGCGEREHWNVRVSKFSSGEHATRPVLQDPCPPLFYAKYKLGLEERLRGWTVERRPRGSGPSGAIDKFYYHMGRQFRSMVEVGKYILYSCRQRDLKQLRRPDRSHDVQEANAAGATMETSFILGTHAESMNMDKEDDIFSNLAEIENLAKYGDVNIETPHRAFEEVDYIFSYLLQMENLANCWGESPRGASEEVNDVFSNFLRIWTFSGFEISF